MHRSDPPVPIVSLHTHTDLSLCGRADMTLEAAVDAAVAQGYHTLGFCDHIHIDSITDRPAHAERLRHYKKRRDEAGWPVQVLIGGEFEVQAKGRIVECAEILDVCEYAVVAPNHYQLDWVDSIAGTCAEVAEHELDHIETALNWPHTSILAHPFAGTVREPGHDPNGMWEAADKGRIRALLDLALARGVALEIQPKLWYQPERTGRVTELIDWWLEMGGLVALGSDAHALASLQTWTERYGEIVKRFNLSAEKMWWPPSGN